MLKRTVLVILGMVLGCFTSTFVSAQNHDETPMQLSGYSFSEAFEIPDDQLLAPNSRTLKQVLYRIKKTSYKSRHEYAEFSQSVTWEQILQETPDYRMWVFDRVARLTKIQKHSFADASSDEEISRFFVCHCVHDDPETGKEIPFVAIARSVPKRLFKQTGPEQVRVTGFLFNRVSNEDFIKPVFVVDRLGWLPDANSELASPSQIQLSKLGVDIGEYDYVPPNNKRALSKRDAEAFYQTIAAVSSDDKPLLESNETLGFRQLMEKSNSNFGNRVRVQGVARTCSQVHVTDPDIRNRLGLSTYYQLILFPNMDGGTITLNNDDGEPLVYRRFPITVCIPKLPKGMTPSDVERKEFEVEGFFFRFWKYKADKTDAANVGGQVSPLIIAQTPTLLVTEQGLLNQVILGFAAIVLAGLAAIIFCYRYADRKHKLAKDSILNELPEQIDIPYVPE